MPAGLQCAARHSCVHRVRGRHWLHWTAASAWARPELMLICLRAQLRGALTCSKLQPCQEPRPHCSLMAQLTMCLFQAPCVCRRQSPASQISALAQAHHLAGTNEDGSPESVQGSANGSLHGGDAAQASLTPSQRRSVGHLPNPTGPP